MKFFKLKRFLSIITVIVAGCVIVFILTITRINDQSISENEVRTQLEQTYDAEVAIVNKNESVYDALITKNGIVYTVEMDALTGEVNSLKQSDEYIIQTESEVAEGPIELIPEKSSQMDGQANLEKKTEEQEETKLETGQAKAPTQIIITEKKTVGNKIVDIAGTPKPSESTTAKPIISATSKIEEKVEEDKPNKEISKDSLKVETSKQEEPKVETPKEETAKTEEKIEAVKLVPAKTTESAKTEEQTSEEKQVQAQVQVSQTNTVQSEAKKPEAETKTETVTTVLISEEQAIKIAQQQQKGTVESSSFVKTNEGGYYLIVMKATISENDSKESAKEKKTKATIQVHAISGKVLSITWQ
ncbi:PepSY domain-containing protein [Psychrobacillus sp. OK032]|uniref:PepSY domain-containing protein n=1 Tax=Psychrobacillus sp. OK032 TaxID=1884358 RepID=UPI0008BB1F6F|nr:PepSY domain-containing protein [Psychrobacillus sp. OK032]SER66689.1 Peptidase propeptide and YPEB domain-containing protein [Psychrobacillus sp. OK032]